MLYPCCEASEVAVDADGQLLYLPPHGLRYIYYAADRGCDLPPWMIVQVADCSVGALVIDAAKDAVVEVIAAESAPEKPLSELYESVQ